MLPQKARGLLLSLFVACAPPPEGPRNDEHRVVVTNSPKGNSGGYLFAMRSPLSSIGVLRADGLSRQETESFGKSLARAIEGCVTREFSRGALIPGATRLEVTIDPAGRIGHIDVTSEPKSAHSGALLCVVSPLHAIGFGVGEARLVLLEALWGATK